MKGENKAGLVVASSFLILIGLVAAVKLRNPAEAPSADPGDEPVAVSPTPPPMSVPATPEKKPAPPAEKPAPPPPGVTSPTETPPPPPGTLVSPPVVAPVPMPVVAPLPGAGSAPADVPPPAEPMTTERKPADDVQALRDELHTVPPDASPAPMPPAPPDNIVLTSGGEGAKPAEVVPPPGTGPLQPPPSNVPEKKDDKEKPKEKKDEGAPLPPPGWGGSPAPPPAPKEEKPPAPPPPPPGEGKAAVVAPPPMPVVEEKPTLEVPVPPPPEEKRPEPKAPAAPPVGKTTSGQPIVRSEFVPRTGERGASGEPPRLLTPRATPKPETAGSTFRPASVEVPPSGGEPRRFPVDERPTPPREDTGARLQPTPPPADAGTPLPPIGSTPRPRTAPIAAGRRPASAPAAPREGYRVELYRAAAGDTWEGLSQHYYGSPRAARALQEFNRQFFQAGERLRQGQLAPGEAFFIPALDVLVKKHGLRLDGASAP